MPVAYITYISVGFCVAVRLW